MGAAVVVGIIAGLLYGLLLVHQKKLNGVNLAHGVTNSGLGIYVLLTGNWMFWQAEWKNSLT